MDNDRPEPGKQITPLSQHMKKILILNEQISSQSELFWDIEDAKILSGYGQSDIDANGRVLVQGSRRLGSMRGSSIECHARANSFDVRRARALAIPQSKKSTTGMSLLESIAADLEGTAL